MILFLDTCACIKLYIDEPGHDVVAQAVHGADSVAAHVIAYAEMRAALAKLRRMKRLSDAGLASIRESFEKDWGRAVLVAPAEPMIRRAGDLAERFGLRGNESVHLAAAESLLLARQRIPVCFASFDESLNEAAARLGLRLLHDLGAGIAWVDGPDVRTPLTRTGSRPDTHGLKPMKLS